MSVNGVTGTSDVYSTYAAQSTVSPKKEVKEEKATEQAADTGVVYEPSSATATDSVKKIYNPDLVAQLKSDSEARVAQLQSLVEKLISKQAGTFNDANDIWSLLREGKVEVDDATREQAKQDISEDGYWGVNKTSDRILDFAQALAGSDPEALEKMRDAFKKGYEQAEKTWGGELPEISKQTYDAVMQKFDDLISQINGTEA